MSNCPKCGHGIEDATASWCPNCGASLAPDAGAGAPGAGAGPPGGPPPGGPPVAPGDPAGPGGGGGGYQQPFVNSVPFEDTSQPFMTRVLETIKLAFTDPVRLFSDMSDGEIGQPVLYGVLIGTIATLFSVIWQFGFGGLAALGQGDAEGLAVTTGLLVLLLLFSPVLALIQIFVGAAIFHVGLMIVGDGDRGFSVTLRAVCYGGTPNLIAIVPICGGVIGGIWGLVLVIMGAIYGHGTDTWRGILGYFLPAIVCCFLVMMLAMMFGLFGAWTSN